MNKIPLRTCVISKNQYPKKDLIRLVVQENNFILLDINQNKPGRGFYISKEKEVIEKFLKSNYTKKRFKIELSNELKEILKKYDKL